MPNRASINQPLPIFLDTQGNLLQNGVIYIGDPNKNAAEFPIPVYENKTDLIPLPQPIRTFNGQPAIDERIIQLYIDQDYSIIVRNQEGELIYSAIVIDAIPASTSYVLATLQDYVTRALLDINLVDYALIANVHNVPPGGDTAYVLTKTSPADYAYNWMPAGTATGTLPIGGVDGQFLQKVGAADYVTTWATLDLSAYALTANVHNIPSGGSAFQFLQKTSSIDYATQWASLDLSVYALITDLSNYALTANVHNVPSGGVTGQYLGKASNTDYALTWITPPTTNSPPAGGTTGQVLAKTSNADYAYAWTSQPYDTGGFYPGQPLASTLVYFHVFARTVTFPINFAGSVGYANTAPTATKTYTINKVTSAGAITAIGTMIWTIGSKNASFTLASATTFNASDMLQVVSSTTDATLSDITFTFVGTR